MKRQTLILFALTHSIEIKMLSNINKTYNAGGKLIHKPCRNYITIDAIAKLIWIFAVAATAYHNINEQYNYFIRMLTLSKNRNRQI